MNNSTEPVTINSRVRISNYLVNQSRRETILEIYDGLQSGLKHISSRFFYDEKGSALFEQITGLNEYYPTRTEKSIIQSAAPDILESENSLEIVELGSGDCSKMSILFDSLDPERYSEIRYYPVDISESALRNSIERLNYKYSGLMIHGIMADFMKDLQSLPGDENRLICFFGSTIGNISREHSANFIFDMGRMMNQGDRFLIGLDMVKDKSMLEKAYNDSKGITEEFNKNILNAVNNIAETDFDAGDFRHVVFYNNEERRIEMHLEALKSVEIESPLFPQKIFINEGETIHTENSHKFTNEDIYQLAGKAGMEVSDIYTDRNNWFSLASFTLPQ